MIMQYRLYWKANTYRNTPPGSSTKMDKNSGGSETKATVYFRTMGAVSNRRCLKKIFVWASILKDF